MNSRERVVSAIRFQEPDKVPVDLGAHPSSGISAIAYSNLLDYLGKQKLPVQIYDVVQQLAQPQDEILDLFGVDVIDIGRAFNHGKDLWHATPLSNGKEAWYPIWFNPVRGENGDWIAHDPNGLAIAKMPKNATFFDQIHYPWLDAYPEKMTGLDEAMNTVLWSAFAHSPWDIADNPDFWTKLRQGVLKLRENSDKALMIGAGCNLFEWGTFIRRMDNFLLDLYMDPANVEKLLDALLEKHFGLLEKIIDSVGDIVDIVRFGDDLGAMNGPFMDPALYRQLFQPRHKAMCDYVKKNSDMNILLHSCGSIYKLIPDLIDAGFEILNPVQTQCTDMEPNKLKNEFGKEVCFWGGGIETVGVLNNGSESEVRAQVLDRLEIMSKGGGYIFNTVHNIMPDVPPQNIIAMYNAVKEFNGEDMLKL